jgi:hypothetical protein
MQDLKIYILIEDPVTKSDVSIKGNFEILRAFLSGVGASVAVPDLIPAQSEEEPVQTLATVEERKMSHESPTQGSC